MRQARLPHPFNGPIDPANNNLNVNQNDTGITKLQYTYSISQSAFLRAYGYTFYSDWYLERSDATAPLAAMTPAFPETAQYQLITHTAGGALNFQDQLNDQNLITLDGNYTSATVIRFNNSTATAVPRRSATWRRRVLPADSRASAIPMASRSRA